MNRNFHARQAEAMVQLHRNSIVSNIRHSQASNSFSETPISRNKDNQASILKDTNKETTASSHIRHFNILDALLDSMEDQRLENYLIMPELDLTMNEDETTIT